VVSISSGKTRTAYVTDQGDTYVWETRAPKGQEGAAGAPAAAAARLVCEPSRLDGVKRVCQVGGCSWPGDACPAGRLGGGKGGGGGAAT
jgi:hypothetical protein